MRTTLTLAPDIEPEVTRLRKELGVSTAQVVNDLIRKGLLSQQLAGRKKKRAYRMRHRFKAKVLVGSLDNVEDILDVAEGEGRR